MVSWEEFAAFFTGSDTAYGEWVQDREPKALTRKTKATEKQWLDHLEGRIGLGIIPVNTDGVSYFGAIDIDIDSIDHAILYEKVTERKFPLTVCRSKSGGAHLYFFTGPLGMPAPQVQGLLARWSAILGYPTAEIFPKQKKLGPDNTGSWINLPYFGGDSTTRYAVGSAGALSLDEFASSVVRYDPHRPTIETNGTKAGEAVLPPCLASMEKDGVTSGYRNQALFNYAVFYRKSDPKAWETLTQARNSQYFSPPLQYREVKGIIESASRVKYQYMCEQEPLKSLCNKEVCRFLPFGVGYPTNDGDSYGEVEFSNLRKLMTDPPMYIIDANGKDVYLSFEELLSNNRFRVRVGQELNCIIAPKKPIPWEIQVNGLLKNVIEIAAPKDASTIGLIIEKLHEFLVLRERATDKADLLRGLPIQDGGFVLFRMTDFRRYLQGHKLDRLPGAEIFLTLQVEGLVHKDIQVNGRKTEVWCYPVSRINEQTESFKIPDFKKDLEEV